MKSSARLVNLKALEFYNGTQEVSQVEQYFDRIDMPAPEKEKVIIDMYFDSFKFISDDSNWGAISRLANHILNSDKPIIEANEAVAVIDSGRFVNN